MDILKGLFANAGQSAANNAAKRQGQVASGYNDLFKLSQGQNEDWLNLLGNLNLTGVFGNALNGINQGPEQAVQKVQNRAAETATFDAGQLANTLKGLGFGDGAIQGATQGLFQNAQRQTNQFAQEAYSPDYVRQQLFALIQALQGGNQLFGGQLASYAQGVYGQPGVQVQQNPLAGLLGQGLGAYSNYLSAEKRK